MVRPYYVADYRLTGRALYANPRALPAVLDLAMRRSYLAYFVVSRMACERRRECGTAPSRSRSRRGPQMELFRDAVAATSEILGLFQGTGCAGGGRGV